MKPNGLFPVNADNNLPTNTMLRSFLGMILSLLFFLPGLTIAGEPAGISKPDTLHCLEIEGKVSNADQLGTPCKIEILLDDVVVDSIILKGGKRKFIYMFKRNQHYTIRMVKQGFQNKSVCVHTFMENADNALYQFYFETTMFLIKPGQIEQPPVATIYFNSRRNCFYYTRTNPYVPGKANCIKPT